MLLDVAVNRLLELGDGVDSDLAQCMAGHKFWTFNCIYTSFTAFPTNKDLPERNS